MNLEKRNSNNARIWILRPQRCISSLSFLPHLPSSIYILYFLFCILYFVLCISYFAFSHLLRLFFCLTGFLNQRAEEEQVCSAAYIAVIICLLVTFCRTAHCMFLLNDVALYIMVILQFSCNRFCFKKRNVFSSQLHCRELPSSAACQFVLGSALPPSLSLCLMFVCISYLVYCTSILEDGLVTHFFSYKKKDLLQPKDHGGCTALRTTYTV